MLSYGKQAFNGNSDTLNHTLLQELDNYSCIQFNNKLMDSQRLCKA